MPKKKRKKNKKKKKKKKKKKFLMQLVYRPYVILAMTRLQKRKAKKYIWRRKNETMTTAAGRAYKIIVINGGATKGNKRGINEAHTM